MLRQAPCCRITVSPVLIPLVTFCTRETSTPASRKRLSAISPIASLPILEQNPTRVPSAARLCATMADDAPSVSAMPWASSSRSGINWAGSPYKIRSRFSSPAMLMSKSAMSRNFVVLHDGHIDAGFGKCLKIAFRNAMIRDHVLHRCRRHDQGKTPPSEFAAIANRYRDFGNLHHDAVDLRLE